MSVYTKNIAVIKGLKQGFSADGGELSGLVKCEKYGSHLTVEVSLINFAPLAEGRFVCAVSDGNCAVIVENGFFEGASELDCKRGFASLICYVNGQVSPVASAICGSFHSVALTLKDVIEGNENTSAPKSSGKKAQATTYDDEAISEVNYYELSEADEGGNALRKDKKQEKTKADAYKDEEAFSAVTQDENRLNGVYPGGNGDCAFYLRLKNEIEGLLKAYPREERLERVIKGSKWVKISYGDGKFYLFGVLYSGDKPRYICYGVPAKSESDPPESMENLATYIPAETEGEGFWVMYQDADTGLSYSVK